MAVETVSDETVIFKEIEGETLKREDGGHPFGGSSVCIWVMGKVSSASKDWARCWSVCLGAGTHAQLVAVTLWLPNFS